MVGLIFTEYCGYIWMQLRFCLLLFFCRCRHAFFTLFLYLTEGLLWGPFPDSCHQAIELLWSNIELFFCPYLIAVVSLLTHSDMVIFIRRLSVYHRPDRPSLCIFLTRFDASQCHWLGSAAFFPLFSAGPRRPDSDFQLA